ncbi:MAG: OsmC family protein [Chloroflexota bacterium]|nr:OsmC family protein [Chloroflexota bacterium]
MSISEAVASASAHLSEHPDEARYRDSVARARIDEGLTVLVGDPQGLEIRTDMQRAIGGNESAPSPGWLFRAAIASCVASLVGIRAAMLEIPLDAVEVEVDSESDDRGILGLDDAIPAGPLSIRIVVTVRARGRASSELDALAHWAVDHCPSAEGLRRAIPVEVEVRSA